MLGIVNHSCSSWNQPTLVTCSSRCLSVVEQSNAVIKHWWKTARACSMMNRSGRVLPKEASLLISHRPLEILCCRSWPRGRVGRTAIELEVARAWRSSRCPIGGTAWVVAESWEPESRAPSVELPRGTILDGVPRACYELAEDGRVAQ